MKRHGEEVYHDSGKTLYPLDGHRQHIGNDAGE